MTDSIRIAAWNVNSLKVRLPHVLRWLQDQEAKQQPIDALCLQELKLTDDKYPHQELEAAGYLSLAAGQKPTTALPSSCARQPLHRLPLMLPPVF